MKVVINVCFGGFSISKKAAEFMAEKGSEQAKAELEQPEGRFYGYGYSEKFPTHYDRSDALLVEAVETLGKEANGSCADLSVVTIPDGINWEIDEYDGNETVEEKHRSWR
jgi:hypothetical protein